MSVYLRFLGDPTGYVVDWNSSDQPNGWLDATIGMTGHRVKVNADKAYLAEPTKPDDDCGCSYCQAKRALAVMT